VEYQRGFSAAAAAPMREKAVLCKRRHYRYEIHSLSYINFDESNGGIIRNLNEVGLCVQSVSPLSPDQEIRLRFELLSPRIRVNAVARVRWISPTGLAGLEFSGLGARSRQLIKDWMLTQLLLRGQHLFVTSSIFASGREVSIANPRMLNAAVPATAPPLLASLDQAQGKKPNPVLWARLVDSAAIVAAVLLFSVIATSMMEGLPDWFSCACVLLLTAGILSSFYWLLFTSWIGATPGNYLVYRVFGVDSNARSAEERTRFR
jgi:hypothetical protein